MWFTSRKRELPKTGALPNSIIAGVPVLNEIVGEPAERPKQFSTREQQSPVRNQLNFNCVGEAGTGLGEFFQKKEPGGLDKLFGAMALFSLAKQFDGLPRTSGTYINNATYIPMKYGHFYESDFPEFGGGIYEPNRFTDPLKQEALKYKAKESVLVDRGSPTTFNGLKDMLWRTKQPIVIGLAIYQNFAPDSQGRIPLPKGEQSLGHAVLMTGYNDTDDRATIEFKNSWGEWWGIGGYGYLPVGYAIYPDAWTGYDLPNDWQTPQPGNADLYGKQRNQASEQRNALMLQAAIYKMFSPYDRARHVAGTKWFTLVNACTYGGYTFTDLINWLYYFSRNNKPLFDLNLVRAEVLKS